MSEINDGGSAFPVVVEGGDNSKLWPELDKGMTLRDYFAAKAMQGYVAACPDVLPPTPRCAEWAYEMADAMLAARDER